MCRRNLAHSKGHSRQVFSCPTDDEPVEDDQVGCDETQASFEHTPIDTTGHQDCSLLLSLESEA